MTNKQIQNLIDKYLAGETSPAEERQLTLALHQRQELPEEWQAVSLMLGELTLGEARHHLSLYGPPPRPRHLGGGPLRGRSSPGGPAFSP